MSYRTGTLNEPSPNDMDAIAGLAARADPISPRYSPSGITLKGELSRRWATHLQKSGGRPTMVIHQPDQATYRSVLPEEIDWKPFPAFPPSARLAIVVGDPSKPGPYVIRVKVPSGVKLMPHQHPEDRVYTVISGVFYFGLGSVFDEERVVAYPPGAVIVLPGGTPHFHHAKSGTYVTQVSAVGPLGLEYIDPIDDPRNQ